jgi:hypothetical protein
MPAPLREIVEFLTRPDLPDAVRAETLAFDLLEPVSPTNLDVPMPADDRAAAVARALALDPTDVRTLDAWGRQSERAGARSPGCGWPRPG